jgi:hypothetical protein
MLKPGMEKNDNYKLDGLKDNKEGSISFSARAQKTWSVGFTMYPYEGSVYSCELEIHGWNKDLKACDLIDGVKRF